MSVFSSGISAIGRLAALAVLAAAFLFGMAGVVYMSLQGEEVTVPEITGKTFEESETELALLGLKIKKRADRFSPETPNTVIEQLPKTGETVKTGQLILVVTSRGPGDSDQPASLKKATEEDDTEKIEEMISDKPKKAKPSASSRKKADTARDVNANAASSTSKSDADTPAAGKKEPAGGKEPADKPKGTQPGPDRQPAPPAVKPGAKPPARP